MISLLDHYDKINMLPPDSLTSNPPCTPSSLPPGPNLIGVALGVAQLGIGSYITAEAGRRERAKKATSFSSSPRAVAVAALNSEGAGARAEAGLPSRGARRGGAEAFSPSAAAGVAGTHRVPVDRPVVGPHDPPPSNLLADAEGVLFSPPSALAPPGDSLLIRLTRSLSRHSAGVGGGGATPYSPLTPVPSGAVVPVGGGGIAARRAGTPRVTESGHGGSDTPPGRV